MRNYVKHGLIAGLAALVLAVPLRAQQRSVAEQENNIRYGTTAGEFLLLPVGGRATALGSAYTALASDISALYWNPAGLAMMQQAGGMISHLDYVADTRWTWLGLATPLGTGERVIGASVGVFGFDDQPEYTVSQPEGTGRTYDVQNAVVTLTYSQAFNDRFSFGLTGKYISEDLANAEASTLALDIGTNYHTELGGRPIRGSFVIYNLGGNLEHRGTRLQTDLPGTDPNLPTSAKPVELLTNDWDLPVMFKVGVAYDFISAANSRLTAAGEFWQPNSNDVSGAVGAEYALTNIQNSGFGAALRGGFHYDPSDRDLDVQNSDMNGMQGDGLSLGGGLSYDFSPERGLGVDYAYRDMGLLGGRHLLSLSVNW